jgi:hypothetical protein
MEENEEQDDDEPASVREGSEAVEAGERGMEDEDEEARDSLERNAAVSEPRTALGEGIDVGEGMYAGGEEREGVEEDKLMRS